MGKRHPRRVRFFVATSLDGFIAGPNGEVDWLFTDRDYGLGPFLASVDTVLLGRKTHDFMVAHGMVAYEGMANYVFTRTPHTSDRPDLRFVSEDPAALVRTLRAAPGKDIWLVGGGALFVDLLKEGLVDDVLLAVHPVILGKGITLFPDDPPTTWLTLVRTEAYDSGLLYAEYRVRRRA